MDPLIAIRLPDDGYFPMIASCSTYRNYLKFLFFPNDQSGKIIESPLFFLVALRRMSPNDLVLAAAISCGGRARGLEPESLMRL